MTTLNLQIDSSVDSNDGQGTGAPGMANTTQFVGKWGGLNEETWYRFPLNCKRGADFTSAVLSVCAKISIPQHADDPVTLRIRGVLGVEGGVNYAEVGAPATEAQFLAWTLTTAYVDWVPGTWVDGTYYPTPDLSAILEEVTGNPYWLPNMNLVLVIKNNAGPDNTERRIYDYSEVAANAAKLVVTFSGGADVKAQQIVPFAMFFTRGAAGIYEPTLAEMQLLKSQGFNTIYLNGHWAANLAAILDNAVTAGMQVVVDFMGSLWDTYFQDGVDTGYTIGVAHAVSDALLDTITPYSNVLGVMLDDEPTMARKNQIRCLKIAMQQYKPNLLYFPGLIDTVADDLANFAATNILVLHTYPINWEAAEGDLRVNAGNDIITYIRAVTAGLSPVIPYWAMIQGHGVGAAPHESWHLRVPTVTEMRMQFWLVLAEGAKGFCFFIYNWGGYAGSGGLKYETALMAEITALATHIPTLAPILLSWARTTDEVTVSSSAAAIASNPTTHATTLVDGAGNYYAVVVNRVITTQDIRIVATAPRLELIDVETGICYQSGVTVSFAAGEGKVFRLKVPTSNSGGVDA